MKKFLLLVMLGGLVCFSNITYAQPASVLAFHAQDTLNTTASKDTVTKFISTTAHYSSFGIQVNVTKISGTISAKAYLYGTIDGTNYQVTDSTAALADGDSQSWFFKTSTPYVKYKIEVRNSIGANTTQKAVVRTYYTARR